MFNTLRGMLAVHGRILLWRPAAALAVEHTAYFFLSSGVIWRKREVSPKDFVSAMLLAIAYGMEEHTMQID